MIEYIGSLGWKKNKILVEVVLDSVELGVVYVSLHQWDRLREHRQEGGPSVECGLQVLVEAREEE